MLRWNAFVLNVYRLWGSLLVSTSMSKTIPLDSSTPNLTSDRTDAGGMLSPLPCGVECELMSFKELI